MSIRKKAKIRTFFSVFLSVLALLACAFCIYMIIRSKNSNAISENAPTSQTVSFYIEEKPLPIPEPSRTNEKGSVQVTPGNLHILEVYYPDGIARGTYEYDEAGRLRSYSSKSTTTTTELTVEDGLEVLTTYSDGKLYSYEYYDSSMRLIKNDNIKNGFTYVYEYDNNGNIISETYTTTEGVLRVTTRKYKGTSLSHSEYYIDSEPASITDYEYNPDGTLKSENYFYVGVDTKWHETVTTYSYDKNGLQTGFFAKTKLASDDDSAFKDYAWKHVSYDDFGRITELSETKDSTNHIYEEKLSYNENGLICTNEFRYYFADTGKTDYLSSSGTIETTYDRVGNVISKITNLSTGSESIDKYEYTYDKDNNILTETCTQNDSIVYKKVYSYY